MSGPGQAGEPAPPRHSTAWIDAVVCPLRVPRDELAAVLPAGGDLTLAPGRPGRLHPVTVEVWRVRDGKLEAAGADAHRWSELAGRAAGFAAGGAVGAALGGALGSLTGAFGGGLAGLPGGPAGIGLGSMAGGLAGWSAGAAFGAASAAATGAGVLGGAGRLMSERGSRLLGTYGEVLITTPCVLQTARGPRPVAYVLRMYTDSPLSRWGEVLFGFGFGKKPAQLVFERASIDVRTRGGRPLLAIRLGSRAARGGPAGQLAFQDDLTAPLLGCQRGRRVLSRLERRFDLPSVRCWPMTAQVHLGEGGVPGVGPGRHRVPAAGPRAGAGAFVATGLRVHLSHPQPVRSTADRGTLV